MDLQEIAATQHHAFTAAQARECGHTWRTVAAAVDGGVWHELLRGVFVERVVWEALDRTAQHNCALHARLLVKKEKWAAARRSAAALQALPFLGYPPDRPQLVRDRAGTRARGHNRHERVADVPAEDLVEVDGISTTTCLRTWADIAAEEPFRNAVVLADGVLRRGVTREQLLERSATFTARRAAEFAEPLAESALESISRVGFLARGLPLPRPQVRVLYAGQEIARVDNLWDEFNTIGQADGALKYKDSTRVMADKWQDELLESVGFVVTRWGWDEAWRQALMANKLDRAFRRGLERRIDPGVTLVQATLQQSLCTWKRVA